MRRAEGEERFWGELKAKERIDGGGNGDQRTIRRDQSRRRPRRKVGKKRKASKGKGKQRGKGRRRSTWDSGGWVIGVSCTFLFKSPAVVKVQRRSLPEALFTTSTRCEQHRRFPRP